MPKDNRRGKKANARTPNIRDQHVQSEDDGDTADNFSVVSSQSDTRSLPAEDEDVEDSNQQEELEENLKDLIDGISQKSAKARTNCLLSLQANLSKQYVFDFILDRKLTLSDGLERCVKRGGADERSSAAYCIALLLTQLGACDDSTDIYRQLAPLLSTLVADGSAPLRARSACAAVLGLCTFIAGGELQDALNTMQNMEAIFKASYLKGDGTAPSHPVELSTLHTSALSSWSLLLSILPSHAIDTFVDSHMNLLPQLLLSSDVELRITAGETIALLYELARENDEDFDENNEDQTSALCEQLRELSTDGHKSKSKKDRRAQRSNFRSILRAVESGEEPGDCVKFGNENMLLDSWVRKLQYDAFCRVLASGMNRHLQENCLLRDIFDLGEPLLANAVSTRKISKYERNLNNAAACKRRTKARAKFRDKRVAVHGES